MSAESTAAVTAAGWLVNLAGLALLAVWARTRHRHLFGRVLEGERELGRLERRLDTRVRKEVRALEHAISGAVTSTGPLLFPSQNGEDTVLYDFFRGREAGFFVEAGAFDGVRLSNTYVLERLGWRGLLVEAHSELAGSCRQNRPGSVVVHAALGAAEAAGEVEFTRADRAREPGPLSFLQANREHTERCLREGHTLRTERVPFTSLNVLLAPLTDRVEVLSLDIEGSELEALHGFDIERYRPEVMVIESNDVVGAHRVADYLGDFGYVPAGRMGENTFYVRPDHLTRLSGLN